MNFEPIPIKALHSVWGRVRPGLERVALKGKERYLPEDVFFALRSGRAVLHFAHDGERYAGFMVLEVYEEPFTHENVIGVWALHAEGQEGNFADALPFRDEAIAYIDSIARSLGIKRVKMSGRKGWTKVLKDQFEPVRVMFERVVPGVQA